MMFLASLIIMRSITVILCALVVLCSGLPRPVKHADKDFLVKQKFVFGLLQNINQESVYSTTKYDEYKNYKILDNLQSYNQPETVEKFVKHCIKHPYPKDEIFTITNPDHAKYTRYLSGVFYLAKDWETFKKVVIWARLTVNKQLFINAFHAATLHRNDFQGIVFPAIYEINPYYFYNTETIQKAQHVKMQGFEGLKKIEDAYTVIISSNYTGQYGHINKEDLLSYYTEDIGLNAFYYYYNIDYPYWTTGPKDRQLSNDKRGAFYLYLHWQLLARYYMERLSNNLGEIDEFNYYVPINSGYQADLRYYNGIHFPNRDNNYNSFYNQDTYYLIDTSEVYEQRILEAVDLGRVILPDLSIDKCDKNKFEECVDTLGNLIQGNANSLNRHFYGSLDQQLRFIVNQEVLPGALLHYETSSRDPAFYSIYKRILRYLWRLYENVEPYTENELNFDGVTVDEVEVDKLITYFDKFDSDITNSVDIENINEAETSDLVKFGRKSHYQGQNFVIKARQNRLNHLPFTIKTTINSDKAQKAAIKFFLGPKYDNYGHKIPLEANRENWLELEHFVVDLVAGKNVIARNSADFTWFVKDRTSYYELYQKLFEATNSETYKFPLDNSEAHCGFPNRLLLPKGKKGGLTFQLFVYVFPYSEPTTPQYTGFDPVISCGIGTGARFVDNTPVGYPFNRKIDQHYWTVKNLHFQDVTIYHKTETEINAIQN